MIGSLNRSPTFCLCMDNLKVCTKGPRALGKALKVIGRVLWTVGMELGLWKCVVVQINKEKCVLAKDYSLLEDRRVSAVANGKTYRCLGIEQVFKPT